MPLIRTPCCFRVQPAGWSTCFVCEAIFTFSGGVVPAGPGSLDRVADASVAARIKRDAELATRAMSMGGVTHMRSGVGEFWQAVVANYKHCLKWRRDVETGDLERMKSRASKGWCPWVAGANRVEPWVPLSVTDVPLAIR